MLGRHGVQGSCQRTVAVSFGAVATRTVERVIPLTRRDQRRLRGRRIRTLGLERHLDDAKTGGVVDQAKNDRAIEGKAIELDLLGDGEGHGHFRHQAGHRVVLQHHFTPFGIKAAN